MSKVKKCLRKYYMINVCLQLLAIDKLPIKNVLKILLIHKHIQVLDLILIWHL